MTSACDAVDGSSTGTRVPLRWGLLEAPTIRRSYPCRRSRQSVSTLPVAVILTSNDGPTLAAKRATSTIPIVFFAIGSDPVTLGLVASINRPGGNVTGASFDSPQLVAKGFDLLCQLVPTAETVAYLTNGASLLSFEETKNSLVAAAGALGRQLVIVECSTNDELGHSFATIVEHGAGAVIAGTLLGVNEDAIVVSGAT